MVQGGQADEGTRREPLTQCTHGDTERVHAEVSEWKRQRAAALRERKWLEMSPEALSPVVADIRSDGAKRFPGCAQASPLMVLLLGAVGSPP